MIFTWKQVRTPAQLAQAWQIRRLVFIDEQGVSEAEEIDGRDEDPGTYHVLVLQGGGQALATARILTPTPGVAQIGRVAVLASHRSKGVGRLVMAAAEQIALAHGALQGQVRVELSAQVNAIGFYRNLGYVIAPKQYLDAGIWHQDAHKIIKV